MADKQNVLVEKNKVVQGREAVDAYRVAHTALHSHGWYKGISEDHTLLLNTLLSSLKVSGFNSLDEYFLAEKPYLNGFLCEEFEAQAIQREVRLIDLRGSGHVYNLAAQEAIKFLNMEGVSPDTLIISHSEVEHQTCINISKDSDASFELDDKSISDANVIVARSQYSGFKPTFISSMCPEPILISTNLYDERTGFALWREIMRQVWGLLGITVDESSTETNDLTVMGKKITGLWVGANFISACLCLDLDFALAEKLTHPLAGASHPVLSISDRMTSAKLVLGRNVDFAEFFAAFKGVLQTVLRLTFIPGHLTIAEEERIADYLPRYQSAAWTWQGIFNGD